MKRVSLVLWATITAIFGTVHPNVARAAELKVLTSVALTSVLDELASMFEKTTKTKLSIDYNLKLLSESVSSKVRVPTLSSCRAA